MPLEPIIIKEGKWTSAAIGTICFLLFLYLVYCILNKPSIFEKILLGVLAAWLLYLAVSQWYKSRTDAIWMRIDAEGITHRKTRIKWMDIDYFYTVLDPSFSDYKYYMGIAFTSGRESIKIELPPQLEEKELRKHIIAFSNNPGIRDGGHEIIHYDHSALKNKKPPVE
ncbi:hypothetical protein ACFOTA_05975 [Chitinophaga sp. GCM10012297]|uniref:PH domain-containing protein n=1 Tax=Chitinophaga chungangae TaxID=2821488 RepID=A0ABS3YAN4_9BACT|nr:hypothetical protein [Chitinophaga chungangae]MBO9151746.1 hypothetical protein [Chitinophaga chungangae]